MKALLSVDPGLRGTGLAYFPDERLAPTWTRVIPAAPGKTWIERSQRMAAAVFMAYTEEVAVVHQSKIRFVCEMMEMHGGARSQMMWKAGDFQHTLVFIGMLCAEFASAEIDLVPPSTWKGQLPKSVAERRIRKLLGEKTCHRLGIHTHAWDAVGIGLWARGRF